MTKIYALLDQVGEVRYIGKTSKTLEWRRYHHVRGAKNGANTHKDRWIRSMLLLGLEPGIVFLHEATGNGVHEEIGFIDCYARLGARLTNMTIGGEGTPGLTRVFTKEWKNNIRKSRIGKRASDSTRAKMSTSHTGKAVSLITRHKLSIIQKRHHLRVERIEMRCAYCNSIFGDTKNRIANGRKFCSKSCASKGRTQ